MDIPETKYARTTDGVHIAYQVFGEGPMDLVYQHGFVGNIDYAWELPNFASFFRALGTFARVLMLDARGSGLSDRVGPNTWPTLEARMDDIGCVMDAAGSGRAVLFGWDIGGMLCALFATSYPERTEALILLGSPAKGTRSSDYPWGWSEGDWDEYLSKTERGWGSIQSAEEHLRWMSPSTPVDPLEVARHAQWYRYSASPGSVVAWEAMERDTDVRAVLPTIRVPTLVLHRTGDIIEPVAQAHYIAEQIPGAKLVELPGDDHSPYRASPADVLDEIERFLGLERRPAEIDRVLATILFTDIVDSTRQAADLGDARWKELLARHDGAARSEITRHRGTYIHTTGDGLLATFDGPARAVRCAQAIGDSVRNLGLEIRSGCHTGEIELAGEDVQGLAVHIGARVSAKAGASEVFVSSTVKDLVAGSGLTFEDAGEHELKGVPDRWRLYRVVS
jgi:pimeloyl-ACP methyl ester carboxylesterase